MKRRMISFALALAMCISLLPGIVNAGSVPAVGGNASDPVLDEGAVPEDLKPITPTMPVNPFTDVLGTDWFIDDVIYVYDQGLMSGTSTEPMLFSPNDTTTRGMIVTILYRYAGAPDVSGAENPFTDVAADQWYADAVKWASGQGIVMGLSDEIFAPDAPITRQDLAVILSRYMEYAGINPVLTQEYIQFSDEADIADYAKGAIQTLYKLDVINGVGNDAIAPNENATRAQVAAMLHRFAAVE